MYWWYIKSQNLFLFALWLSPFIIFEFGRVYGSMWISFWTDDPRFNSTATPSYSTVVVTEAQISSTTSTPVTLSNSATATAPINALFNRTSESTELNPLHFYYMAGYMVITLIRALLLIVHAIFIAFANVHAARVIHEKLIGIYLHYFINISF